MAASQSPGFAAPFLSAAAIAVAAPIKVGWLSPGAARCSRSSPEFKTRPVPQFSRACLTATATSFGGRLETGTAVKRVTLDLINPPARPLPHISIVAREPAGTCQRRLRFGLAFKPSAHAVLRSRVSSMSARGCVRLASIAPPIHPSHPSRREVVISRVLGIHAPTTRAGSGARFARRATVSRDLDCPSRCRRLATTPLRTLRAAVQETQPC